MLVSGSAKLEGKVAIATGVGQDIGEQSRVTLDVLVKNAHSFTDHLPLSDPKMMENCKIDCQSAFSPTRPARKRSA